MTGAFLYCIIDIETRLTLDGLEGTHGTRELYLLITFAWLDNVFALENTVCHQIHSQYTRGKRLLLHCSF